MTSASAPHTVPTSDRQLERSQDAKDMDSERAAPVVVKTVARPAAGSVRGSADECECGVADEMDTSSASLPSAKDCARLKGTAGDEELMADTAEWK